MNELHVKSKLHNQKDVLETLENLASQEELSEAIEELKAGTLPVYDKDVTIREVTDNEDKDNLGMFLYDGVLVLFYIEGASGSNVYMYVFNISENGGIEYWTFTYTDTDITLADCYDNSEMISEYATKADVGTKLYKHHATGTYTDTNDNVYSANIQFIATESEQLTLIDSGLITIVSGLLTLNGNTIIIIKYDYSQGYLLCYDEHNNTLFIDSNDSFSFTNDTVTPL